MKTRLTDILEVEHPVMLAGMGGVSYSALCAAVSEAGGFGKDGKPFFWISGSDRYRPVDGGLHVAFECENHELVDAFHTAALAAGGTDNGAAGPRPIYHPNYYGAFVLDPDGHNVEVVNHNR